MAWYEAHGYEVVARNWRCREGELDIVARRGRLHVFCEVKSRSSDAFGVPAEAVGRPKRARLRRLAALWFAAHPRRLSGPGVPAAGRARPLRCGLRAGRSARGDRGRPIGGAAGLLPVLGGLQA